VEGSGGLQKWGVAANMLNKQSWITDKVSLQLLGNWVRGWLTAPYYEKLVCYRMLQKALNLKGFCENGEEL
jgi:hypothetical protein